MKRMHRVEMERYDTKVKEAMEDGNRREERIRKEMEERMERQLQTVEKLILDK